MRDGDGLAARIDAQTFAELAKRLPAKARGVFAAFAKSTRRISPKSRTDDYANASFTTNVKPQI